MNKPYWLMRKDSFWNKFNLLTKIAVPIIAVVCLIYRKYLAAAILLFLTLADIYLYFHYRKSARAQGEMQKMLKKVE